MPGGSPADVIDYLVEHFSMPTKEPNGRRVASSESVVSLLERGLQKYTTGRLAVMKDALYTARSAARQEAAAKAAAEAIASGSSIDGSNRAANYAVVSPEEVRRRYAAEIEVPHAVVIEPLDD